MGIRYKYGKLMRRALAGDMGLPDLQLRTPAATPLAHLVPMGRPVICSEAPPGYRVIHNTEALRERMVMFPPRETRIFRTEV